MSITDRSPEAPQGERRVNILGIQCGEHDMAHRRIPLPAKDSHAPGTDCARVSYPVTAPCGPWALSKNNVKGVEHLMMSVYPIHLSGYTCIAVDVALPKTRLLAIQTATGYIMCGALDISLLNSRLADRKIIAGRAVGVRTIDELLDAPLESVTAEAGAIGWAPGICCRDALLRLCRREAESD